jgi:FMN phosphatase YigB (HAD superfamily)
MSPDDFEYVTAYENSSYCKPSPGYFTELLDKLGIDPCECVMVGNDTKDDFAAHALGIPVFILTDGLINQGGVNLDAYPHGGFDDLISYIRSI